MTETTASQLLGPTGIELPLNPEEADRTADEALGLQLGTTTRDEIDEYTRLLSKLVIAFSGAVQAAGGIGARGSWLEAAQVLESGPRDDSLVFNAWAHARDVARVLRGLVTEYRNQMEESVPALPARTPRASLDKLDFGTQPPVNEESRRWPRSCPSGARRPTTSGSTT
ncbi:hypothetical protein ACF1D2_32245 [Streptomyces bacillaris]|uniref:Uncharacterized protein n=2 Tax=Streptomyces TaxID=1883 RepID=A0A1E7LEJ4_9ACTN|nr:hypothetical protein [Streptomyces nanshensis]OEV14629.1 hypothetical protein AN221_43025 [Streptomyces nanshensis]